MGLRKSPRRPMRWRGGLQSQAVASFRPAAHWWLQLLSLALLVLLLSAKRSASCRGAAAPGSTPTASAAARLWLRLAVCLAWLAGTFWWLYISMHTYGGLAALLAVLAVLALGGFLALYYAAACGLFLCLLARKSTPTGSGVRLVFAALWTLAELARGVWFTGFPWGAGGYAHVGGPLAGYAPGWACTVWARWRPGSRRRWRCCCRARRAVICRPAGSRRAWRPGLTVRAARAQARWSTATTRRQRAR